MPGFAPRNTRQIIRQQRRQIDELETQVADLTRQLAERDARIARLEQQVAALTAQVARLSKNSTNSSKPPSSDIVKPPPLPGKKGRRRLGGQPGHAQHLRPPFLPDQIDHVVDHVLERCPVCGTPVRRMKRPARIVQQAELEPMPIRISEHHCWAFWCSHCQSIHYAPLPAEVRQAGLLGPRLTALGAYLKGVCHVSFSTIRKFCRDVLGLRISRGQLAKIIYKASRAMQPAYEQLAADLPGQRRLNVDETGHKHNGQGHWTWCFRAELYTLFKIDCSRGHEVLVQMLGSEFAGVLGCDYFSAYRTYMRDFGVTVQFCLAHLIRDVKFLAELPDRVTAAYGQRVLKSLRRLFGVIHRRQRMEEPSFQRALERARDAVLKVGKRAPARIEAQHLAERFRKHGEAYFRFITTPDIEPTNNLAEQAIRFVVMDRHVTQGTRSQRGQRWAERIWTAIATCTQQQRSVFEYLYQTISAYFAGQPTPSLMPAGP